MTESPETRTVTHPGDVTLRDDRVSVGCIEFSCDHGAVFAALAEVQCTRPVVKKGKKAEVKKDGRAVFSYSYADLAATLAAIRAAMGQAGLAVTQGVQLELARVDQPALVVVTTMLLHTSGEWIGCTLRAPMVTRAASQIQALGSSVSYLRRYALTALVGLATEDDDGQGGVGPPKPAKSAVDQLRAAWHGKLAELVKRQAIPSLDETERHLVQSHLWGVESSSALTEDQASWHLAQLRQTLPDKLSGIIKRLIVGEDVNDD